MNRGFLLTFALTLWVGSSFARALAAPYWDESFQIELTRAAEVGKLAVQPDGKIVIVGDFSEVEEVSRRGIARLDVDGTIDRKFDPGPIFDGTAILVRVQIDSKILIGGFIDDHFIFKRFKSDGSLDDSFNFGLGIEPSGFHDLAVCDMLLLPDGKILVGGRFQIVQGESRTCLARFNPDGSMDPSFNSSASFEDRDTVTHLYLRDNGDVYFTVVYPRSLTYFGFGRLKEDGTVDPTISLNDGRWSRVDTLTFASGGRLVLFGEFSGVKGFAVRLNPDNTLDPTFSLPLNYWPGLTKPLSDGRTLLVGVGNPVLILNADGNLESSIQNNGNLGGGDAGFQPNGQIILAGGSPKLLNGKLNFGLVRLLEDGALDSSFAMPGGVMNTCSGMQQVIPQPDGKVLLRSDDAYYANGIGIQPTLVRFNTNATIDIKFAYSGPGLSGPALITPQSDGKLLLGSGDRVYRLTAVGDLDAGFNHWIRCEIVSNIVRLPTPIEQINPAAPSRRTLRPNWFERQGLLVMSEKYTSEECQFLERNVLIIRKVMVDGSYFPNFSAVEPNPFQLDCFPDPNFGQLCAPMYSEIRHIVPSRRNGAFYIAGFFSSLNGVGRTNLARILPNGTVDGNFQPDEPSPIVGLGVVGNDDVASSS